MLSLISFPNLRLSTFPYRRSRRVETLSSMSRHVSDEIQAFCLASRGVGFGTALRRAANRVSVREGSAGGGDAIKGLVGKTLLSIYL